MTKSTHETNGDVAVLTLSNPPANLFTLEVGEDIRAGVQRAREEGARAMVIQADGAVFSGGADVSLFKDRSLEEARDLMIGFMPILAAIEDAPFPVIAAVHGICFAAGLEIALACDLIIASENATFALPEPRVGLAALAGGVHRLPRQIGLKRAMGMILTARHVSAKEGLELGFVNEVVPQGEALAGALRWAEMITKNSPMSIRASKQTIRKGLGVSLEQAIEEQREYPAVKAMAASQDYIEGPKAFAEKRPPNSQGK